ncbi:hypothetical protein [Azospirillum canadense]|uniref:hypothetical protein n=1 Tax=Azospirillum canadense TaxID=403962 RepID=UPI0022267C51|nr:hypothetical protein [Azospirillum canadense]MCW2242912.1 hypothetical protein [Azospirillum canadense]
MGYVPTVSKLRNEPLWRNRKGITVSEMAGRWGIANATLRALLDHHGFLETVSYGGTQRRALVPDNVFYAEYGHNVLPGIGKASIGDSNTTTVFPVFYEEFLENIRWCLDYDGITNAVNMIERKKDRLKYLIGNHGYLPNTEIASLSGYTVNGVSVARARMSGECEMSMAA